MLKELQDRVGLTYLFIGHDLAVAQYFCDRIAVLYLGEIVEMAPSNVLFKNPRHPYTVALLSAVPIPEPGGTKIRDRVLLEGEVGSSGAPTVGCPFKPRCPIGKERSICGEQRPALLSSEEGHSVACHFPGEFKATVAATAA